MLFLCPSITFVFHGFIAVMAITIWVASVEAVPTIPRPDVLNATSSAIKSRQLVVNPSVPTGATGLSVGNSANGIQSPLQSLALLQQVTNSGNSQLSIAAELEAQKQEKVQLQNQQQQMGLLANVQHQQDQISTTQAAITSTVYVM